MSLSLDRMRPHPVRHLSKSFDEQLTLFEGGGASMVQINFASREVNCKIVYYGPGRCGKTTNLQLVHEKAPANSTGELVSIATETDRTLYFDFLPLDLGTVAGMRTKFQLYTVPGQVYYDD